MISNSVKIFKKCIKDMCKENDSLINKIISLKKLTYSKSQFLNEF